MSILSWIGNVVDHGSQRHSNSVSLVDADGNLATGQYPAGYDASADGVGVIGLLWKTLHQLRDVGIATSGAAPVTASAVNAGASITSDINGAFPATPGLRLFGYSAAEDAAVPAQASFRIMHGATVAGGVQVEPVTLSALESTSDYWGPEGVDVSNGISVDWISGSFKLSLKTKVVA